jgi:hypothetical protein
MIVNLTAEEVTDAIGVALIRRNLLKKGQNYGIIEMNPQDKDKVLVVGIYGNDDNLVMAPK